MRFLITQGVSAYRLGAVGYADLHPIDSNATAAGRAHNRRVTTCGRRNERSIPHVIFRVRR